MKKTKGGKDNKVKYGTVSLPMPLVEKIKGKIKGTGMSSVSSYVTFVLRQIFASGEDEKRVRDRLGKLGYI